jgi:hypothetical protein
MAATKAFGMGVNKKNARYTIHDGLPWSIEVFSQKAGRAGRDETRNDSKCCIMFSDESDSSREKGIQGNSGTKCPEPSSAWRNWGAGLMRPSIQWFPRQHKACFSADGASNGVPETEFVGVLPGALRS